MVAEGPARRPQNGRERGHDLVVSPADQLYFDYHQGEGEPGAPWEGNKGGPQSIGKMLAWEPVPKDLTRRRSRVIGIEAASGPSSSRRSAICIS